MPRTKPLVWESNADGKYYHDACFEPTEGRDGFTVVADMDDLIDEECESCGGVFLGFLDDDIADDDDEDGGEA